MALQFPDNREVMEPTGNTFGLVWLRWLNAIHRRLRGFDDVATILTADVGAAGATYSQAQMQLVVDLLNEVKAKTNTTITTLKS